MSLDLSYGASTINLATGNRVITPPPAAAIPWTVPSRPVGDGKVASAAAVPICTCWPAGPTGHDGDCPRLAPITKTP